jgi:phosphoenolpyruvate carboxylase
MTMGVTGLLKASRALGGGSTGNASSPNPSGADPLEFHPVMDELTRLGEAAYREFTDRTPHMMDYFYEITPVNEIGYLNMGSRPSHRTKTDRSKYSVRAIPWVFAWAQSRQTLPAWFGLGTALEQWTGNQPERLATLRRMYREWPFFRTLLDNCQMSLSKAEMSIAHEYSKLCSDAGWAETIYLRIKDEHATTVRMVLDITQSGELLAENPSLALSLARRNPYLDPINQMQVAALVKSRAASDDAERAKWLTPLLRSINALASGMRNTG